MRIKFKKFKPTNIFLKLFGANRDSSHFGTDLEGETNASYEYYYKRGNTYYFRNNEGSKVTIDYREPQRELIRGNRYQIDDLNNINS